MAKRWIVELDGTHAHVECVHCGIESKVPMTFAQHEAWTFGRKYIQDVLPDAPTSDRELLVSGTCGSCWERLYSWMDENDATPCEID